MKKRWLIITAAVFMLFAAAGCSQQAVVQDKMIVAVGIVPEAAFVEKVAGELVEVVTMIPPGNSPANYEPSTQEMEQFSTAKVYFTLQMPTEQTNILPVVQDFNENIEIVDLREIVSEQYPLLYSSHHHDEEEGEQKDQEAEEEHDEEEQAIDPHIWLSPKRVIVMVQAITDKLSEVDPQNAETYTANADAYIEELEALDSEIKETVSGMESKKFLIYHPAYTYFADDYGLEMISIEVEGKQATASELQQVIDEASENNITTVFYQEEFDDRQAQTVADEIGGKVAKVSPLAYDYIESMKAAAEALSQ